MGKNNSQIFKVTFAFLFLLIGCREKSDIKIGKRGVEAAQRIIGVKAQIKDAGQVKWQLISPEAEIFEGRNSLLVTQPNIKVYSGNELSSTLSSGTGNINLDTMDMELYNGAVAVSTTSAKISGKQFTYLSNKNLIISTMPVQIIRDGSITTGTGLEATPDLSHITIKNQRLELEK